MCMCRKDLKFTHCPDGKVADVLAPTHACTTANASVYYRGCVPQRPCKVPSIALMGKMLTRLPRVSLAQLRTLPSTTGGACRRDLESSHRPDGKNADTLASSLTCTTVAGASMDYSKYVPQRPRKFPSPRWETHMFCACACRAVVSMSRAAQ